MRIQEATQAVYNHLPTAPVIAKSAMTMAVAAVALEVLSSLPGAEAGVITYGICWAGCNAALAAATLSPAGLVICYEGCIPFAAPWLP